MSSALEMTPPAPALRGTTSSVKQKGVRLPVRVHACESFPDAWASDGQSVDEVMLRRLKRRSVTNAGYDVFAYFATMCAPKINIWGL